MFFCYLLQTEKESSLEKLYTYMRTAWAFISSLLVSLTRHLMKYSRDYRYVSKTLSVEKKKLKVLSCFYFFIYSLTKYVTAICIYVCTVLGKGRLRYRTPRGISNDMGAVAGNFSSSVSVNY